MELDFRLFKAVSSGDVRKVISLLADGADANAKLVAVDEESGDVTPIHVAAMAGHADIVRILIEAGADKDDRNSRGMTPLHQAANRNKDKVVRALLSYGANKEAMEYRLNFRPIHYAASRGHDAIVTILLEAHVDNNALDLNGVSPLHYAVYIGHTVIIKKLVDAGADTKIRVGGETLYELAVVRGHHAAAALLRKAKT